MNLDGLVNDYAFAQFVSTDTSVRDAIRLTGVEYYIGRVQGPQLEELSGCARTLWVSPSAAPYFDSLNTLTRVPIRVMDVRSCRRR